MYGFTRERARSPRHRSRPVLILAVFSLPLAAGCSSEDAGSTSTNHDAGVSDAPLDVVFGTGDAGDEEAFESCMAAYCENDLYDPCCCIPTTLQLSESSPCVYDYPTGVDTKWGPYTPPPELIRVGLADESGEADTVPFVADASACGDEPGYHLAYEEDGEVPTSIRLCAATCSSAGGEIAFQSGCYTIVCC